MGYAIRGHQRSSEVIRGYQRSAVPAFGASTTTGSSHKEFPNKELPNKESTTSRSWLPVPLAQKPVPPPTKEPPACKEGEPSACNQGPPKARAGGRPRDEGRLEEPPAAPTCRR